MLPRCNSRGREWLLPSLMSNYLIFLSDFVAAMKRIDFSVVTIELVAQKLVSFVRLCPSVIQLVRPSVHPSFRLSFVTSRGSDSFHSFAVRATPRICQLITLVSPWLARPRFSTSAILHNSLVKKHTKKMLFSRCLVLKSAASKAAVTSTAAGAARRSFVTTATNKIAVGDKVPEVTVFEDTPGGAVRC